MAKTAANIQKVLDITNVSKVSRRLPKKDNFQLYRSVSREMTLDDFQPFKQEREFCSSSLNTNFEDIEELFVQAGIDFQNMSDSIARAFNKKTEAVETKSSVEAESADDDFADFFTVKNTFSVDGIQGDNERLKEDLRKLQDFEALKKNYYNHVPNLTYDIIRKYVQEQAQSNQSPFVYTRSEKHEKTDWRYFDYLIINAEYRSKGLEEYYDLVIPYFKCNLKTKLYQLIYARVPFRWDDNGITTFSKNVKSNSYAERSILDLIRQTPKHTHSTMQEFLETYLDENVLEFEETSMCDTAVDEDTEFVSYNQLKQLGSEMTLFKHMENPRDFQPKYVLTEDGFLAPLPEKLKNSRASSDNDSVIENDSVSGRNSVSDRGDSKNLAEYNFTKSEESSDLWAEADLERVPKDMLTKFIARLNEEADTEDSSAESSALYLPFRSSVYQSSLLRKVDALLQSATIDPTLKPPTPTHRSSHFLHNGKKDGQ